jgi:hypothetical protein
MKGNILRERLILSFKFQTTNMIESESKLKVFKNSKSNRMEIDRYNAGCATERRFRSHFMFSTFYRTESIDFTSLLYCDETFRAENL